MIRFNNGIFYFTLFFMVGALLAMGRYEVLIAGLVAGCAMTLIIRGLQ